MRIGGAALALAALAALAGCSGGGAPAGPAPGSATTGGTAPPGAAYSAQRLRQALLPVAAGYRLAAPPDAGEYQRLRAIQNFGRLQGQVTLDKPQCAGVSAAFASAPEVGHAPAAIGTFARDDGQTLTETLMSLPDAVADRQVRLRVPAGCRTFRARIGSDWSSHQATEVAGAQIGAASRTVGVVSTTGTAKLHTWYVVLRSRGYLATVMLHGGAVTREQAEELARRCYEQAERTLS